MIIEKTPFMTVSKSSIAENGNNLKGPIVCTDKSILKVWNKLLEDLQSWKDEYPFDITKIDRTLYYFDSMTSFYAIVDMFEKDLKEKMGFDYDYRIYYSKQIVLDYERSRLLATKNFLMHELIHTFPDCFNHGKVWKKYVLDLNEKHGFRINPKPYSLKPHPKLF